MRRSLLLIIDTLQNLALATWVGGLIMMLAAALPAGEPVASSLLTRFGPILEISGLVVIGAQWVLRRRYAQPRAVFIADGVRQLLTIGALFFGEYSRYVLRMRPHSGAGALPVGSGEVSLLALELVLLIGVVAVTAYLGLAGAAPAAPAASVRPGPPAAAGTTRKRGR